MVIRALHDLIEFGESSLIVHISHISRLKLSPRDHENDAVEAVRLDAGKICPHVVILCPPVVDRPGITEVGHGF